MYIYISLFKIKTGKRLTPVSNCDGIQKKAEFSMKKTANNGSSNYAENYFLTTESEQQSCGYLLLTMSHLHGREIIPSTQHGSLGSSESSEFRELSTYHRDIVFIQGTWSAFREEITKGSGSASVVTFITLRHSSDISIYKLNELLSFREPAPGELRTEDYTAR